MDELTVKQHPSFHNDILYMDGSFFSFGRHITASSNNQERISLAIQIFEVESTKKHRGSCDHTLTKVQFLAKFRDNCKWAVVIIQVGVKSVLHTIRKKYAQQSQVLFAGITTILPTSLCQSRPVDDPTSTTDK